jgi:hypothetical protein
MLEKYLDIEGQNCNSDTMSMAFFSVSYVQSDSPYPKNRSKKPLDTYSQNLVLVVLPVDFTIV